LTIATRVIGRRRGLARRIRLKRELTRVEHMLQHCKVMFALANRIIHG
jgi:hypothetical protein